jgi:hypothetical protein
MIEAHLAAALRCLRLQAAIVRARQSEAIHADEVGRLEAALGEAAETERGLRADAKLLPLDVISRRLGLRPVDELVLLAAVALEHDPLFATIASALLGEEPRAGIHAKLIAMILGLVDDRALAIGLNDDHPLVCTGLLESPRGHGVVDTLRPWRAAPRVVSFLWGSSELDHALTHCADVVVPPAEVDLGHLESTVSVLESVLASNEDVVVCLQGQEGVGRRTLAAVAARKVGREIVALDAARLSMDPSRFADELRALRRECWLRGAVPVIARLDAFQRRDGTSAARLTELGAALEARGGVQGPAILTCTADTELPAFARRVVRLRVASPDSEGRRQMWARALGGVPGPGSRPQTPRLELVAERYAMTPGAIARAAANARMVARETAVTMEHVVTGLGIEIEERFGGLATRVRISQTWDDLVLPADTLDEINAFVSRATHTGTVYDQWGFREKLQRGLGLAALFSGPPGTGKTMVAGLIANTLGLELYIVDLAAVVSKWVGETEKQLGKIFDAAGMGHSLLLFDEGDALFSKRTEVKSSNDRYANLEVNYLLQRIEQFGGVAILTTNLETAVDPAFKRRLAADVHFYPPEREERTKLWRTLLPIRAPVRAPLDFGALADAFPDMCGGHIRNSVLRAAFLAAGEQHPITQAHLQRAARTEYRAMGKVV